MTALDALTHDVGQHWTHRVPCHVGVARFRMTSCDNWRRNWTKFDCRNCHCDNVRHCVVCEQRR